MEGPTDGSEAEALVNSMELIKEHSNDDKDGVASIVRKPNGSLAIKEIARLRCSTSISKPPNRLEI